MFGEFEVALLTNKKKFSVVWLGVTLCKCCYTILVLYYFIESILRRFVSYSSCKYNRLDEMRTPVPQNDCHILLRNGEFKLKTLGYWDYLHT